MPSDTPTDTGSESYPSSFPKHEQAPPAPAQPDVGSEADPTDTAAEA